jgi:FkbM family methyltransferase
MRPGAPRLITHFAAWRSRGGGRRGYAERQAHDARLIDALLNEVITYDADCVDVGAHRGEYLDEFLRRAPRGAHVAIEPLPGFADRLRAQYPGVRVLACAVGERHGTDVAFFHQVDAPAWSSLTAAHSPTGGLRIEPLNVPMCRLDAIVTQADLVKIDVEGAELAVLRGAAGLFDQAPPIVLFEHAHIHARHYGTEAADLWEVLASYDMDVFSLDGRGPHERRAFASICRRAQELNYRLGAETNFVARPR